MSSVRLVGALLLFYSLGIWAQPPAAVGVDPVNVEPVSQTQPLMGRLVAVQQGSVAARVAGPVDRVEVRVGDRVKQGDVLAQLETSRLEAQYAQAERTVDESRARLETVRAVTKLAEQKLARLERLRNTPAFSQDEFDERIEAVAVARSRRAEVEAQLSSRESSLALAAIDLEDATVRAPYEGTVSRRYVSAGDWVREGAAVVDLIDDFNLEVEVEVPADRVAALQPGMEIGLFLGGRTRDREAPHRAVVRAIVPDEDPASRTRPVRLVPSFGTTLDMPLAVNQDVVLQIPVSVQQQVVSVSKDAVLHQGEQAMVYVVVDGAASPRQIILGEALGGRFRVLEGLSPGDVVVVRGNERLRPGQPVRAENASAVEG